MPSGHAAAEPPVEMTGFIVSAEWVFSDPRSASARIVKGKCAVCDAARSG